MMSLLVSQNGFTTTSRLIFVCSFMNNLYIHTFYIFRIMIIQNIIIVIKYIVQCKWYAMLCYAVL